MALLSEPWLLTNNWNLVNDQYYRVQEFYEFPWSGAKSVISDTDLIDVASYGGAIATSRAPHTSVTIFSASGSPISKFSWSEDRKIFAIAWNHLEELICVSDQCNVYLYTLNGIFSREIEIGENSNITSFSHLCTDSDTYIGIITKGNKLFVKGISSDGPATSYDIEASIGDKPICWTLLPTVEQSYNSPTAIVCGPRYNKNVIIVTKEGNKIRNPHFSKPYDWVIDIALSFDKKYLALLSNSNLIWVGKPDIKEKYYEITLERDVNPISFCWCSNSALVCAWTDFVSLYANGDSPAKFFYPNFLAMRPEMDGVRIITNEKNLFLQRIHDSLRNVYMGISTPEHLLFESYREFMLKTSRTFVVLERVLPHLEDAIPKLIQIACHEFEVEKQTILLKAAMYGFSLCESDKIIQFQPAFNKLKIINNFIGIRISIPLSILQYEKLPPKRHLKRLLARNLYGAAHSVATLLKDKTSLTKILTEWALSVLEDTEKSDNEAAEILLTKLSNSSDISFPYLANKAVDLNRNTLATILLEKKIRIEEQIPILMKMNQIPKAMKQALQSVDTNLVYRIIFHLKETLSFSEFLIKIGKNNVVSSLAGKVFLHFQPSNLLLLYKQEDNFKMLACIMLQRSFEQTFDEKMKTIREIQKFVGSKGILSQLLADQIKLLQFQKKSIPESTSTSSITSQPHGMSLHGLSHLETISKMILIHETSHVESVSHELKIPSTRFWPIAINALSKAGKWDKLRQLYNYKRSSCGTLVFAEAAWTYGYEAEALFYIQKCQDEDVVGFFLGINDVRSAADVALASRSYKDIERVLNECNPAVHLDIIQQLQTMRR